MRTSNWIFLSILIASCAFTKCSKHSSPPGLNVDFRGMQPDMVRPYVNGTWKLAFQYGGFGGTGPGSYVYIKNFFWQIGPGNAFAQRIGDSLISSGQAKWETAVDVALDTIPVCTISFNDQRNVPYAYVIYKIQNDTLIMVERTYDPIFFKLTKQSK